ncbi:MAG: type II toxin-antitoxin system RelE/ParE family toxin [Aphanocapsa sp. GSE-SYN-MK-11-07L]|jgi:mRNA interferase RelE/StbE|nr:type II toxin-antitoxin system RelE/ParE family toxin [Aphanocapsa sp. GSE-SYN-MK-11-07L]
MKLKFSKSAIKFLEKLDAKNANKIRERLATLLHSIEENGIIPFTELDLKKLKGDWDGFFRLRIGKIRVIFALDANENELLVYEIDFRGDVYK